MLYVISFVMESSIFFFFLCTPNKDELFYGNNKVSHYCLHYWIQVPDRYICDRILNYLMWYTGRIFFQCATDQYHIII